MLLGWLLPRWLHCSPFPLTAPVVLEKRSGFWAAGGCQAGVLAQRDPVSPVPIPASLPGHCRRLCQHLILTTWHQCPCDLGGDSTAESCRDKALACGRQAQHKDLLVFVWSFINTQKNVKVTGTGQDWCGWLGFSGAQCLSPLPCNDPLWDGLRVAGKVLMVFYFLWSRNVVVLELQRIPCE